MRPAVEAGQVNQGVRYEKIGHNSIGNGGICRWDRLCLLVRGWK